MMFENYIIILYAHFKIKRLNEYFVDVANYTIVREINIMNKIKNIFGSLKGHFEYT